ncbi:MAG: hypothetical protein L6Q73_20430 [Aquabacterium sp.]|nr:hypothetical protein [Aquabacterium sp.]
MKRLLDLSIGAKVFVNCNDAARYDGATLVAVADGYFTVEPDLPWIPHSPDQRFQVSYPYSSVLSVAHGSDGPLRPPPREGWTPSLYAPAAAPKTAGSGSLWIEVNRLVIYKGSVSVGATFTFPE